jgi:hypothetical protein
MRTDLAVCRVHFIKKGAVHAVLLVTWTPRPSQGPCHRHKRFKFNQLALNPKNAAPLLCGEGANCQGERSIAKRSTNAITSIARVDFPARGRLPIIHARQGASHQGNLIARFSLSATSAVAFFFRPENDIGRPEVSRCKPVNLFMPMGA